MVHTDIVSRIGAVDESIPELKKLNTSKEIS
jgi:hypothetical protein